uniref:DUF5644 domain-containing protein n=1 Tax=uncultured Helicobacter sp. TaxID=175537 RepID=A0A650EL41_9HELI|nr:hypothetical protein Helico5904_1210 [uncultured Helicobacter sp.]
MDRLTLNVFRFTAGIDYLPYYQKLSFCFQDSHCLEDVLQYIQKEIRGFEYEQDRLALRLNGIVIFENLPVMDLVQRFGNEWVIEPVSIYYAKKDLILDKKAIWKRYETFFQDADFLTKSDKEAFEEYMMINFITPMDNEQYYGDGFFLYIKWLLSRYPQKSEELLEILKDKKGGIMNFVSVAEFAYPKAEKIDQEIWDMIRERFELYN